MNDDSESFLHIKYTTSYYTCTSHYHPSMDKKLAFICELGIVHNDYIQENA